MKRWIIAFSLVLVCLPAFAQNTDEPASKDDIILYLRTMHSHDMLRRMMGIQAQSMQQLFHDMLAKDGKLPANFDVLFKKQMDDLIENMPVDELEQAMLPAYQKHFTKGDIQAMNGFYSSAVGQKVLAELPEVMQEGSHAAMPIMGKYLNDWKDRMQHEFEAPKPPAAQPDSKNTPKQ